MLPHKVQVNPYDPDGTPGHRRERAPNPKFTNDGSGCDDARLEDVPGRERHFDRPPTWHFCRRNDVRGRRLQQRSRCEVDSHGKFLMAWGSKGSRAKPFNSVPAFACRFASGASTLPTVTTSCPGIRRVGKYLDEWADIRNPATDGHRGSVSLVTSGLATSWRNTTRTASSCSLGILRFVSRGLNNPHQISVIRTGSVHRRFGQQPRTEVQAESGRPSGQARRSAVQMNRRSRRWHAADRVPPQVRSRSRADLTDCTERYG